MAPDKVEELRTAYRREEVILFVGAGVSLSLGVPPWSALIDHMARELGREPRAFRDGANYLALLLWLRQQLG